MSIYTSVAMDLDKIVFRAGGWRIHLRKADAWILSIARWNAHFVHCEIFYDSLHLLDLKSGQESRYLKELHCV
jgi:hypothetical protein